MTRNYGRAVVGAALACLALALIADPAQATKPPPGPSPYTYYYSLDGSTLTINGTPGDDNYTFTFSTVVHLASILRSHLAQVRVPS